MNAPYDGDRGQGAGGDRRDQYPPPPPGAQEPQRPGPYAQDPYLRDAYAAEPYPGRAPAGQEPAQGAPYGGGPLLPPPGPVQPQQGHQQPWPPAPEPGGPSYAFDDAATQVIGVDGLSGRAPEPPQRDAFAHLYRDQQQPYEPQRPAGQQIPAPGQYSPLPTPPQVPSAEPLSEPEPEELPSAQATAPASAKGGRAASLLKSSAVMAAGTMVSRVLGFARNLVMAAAIGVGTLNDGYQVANTLPTMIYILVGGGALNAVFIPQLVRAMKNDEDGGEAYANRLLTLVVVLMAGVTTVCVLGAPLFIKLMMGDAASDPAKLDVAVAFARYCLPTMFFMGVHVVLGQILNARGRFGAMMWTPVLNNIIIIATFGAFIWAFGPFSTTGVDSGNHSGGGRPTPRHRHPARSRRPGPGDAALPARGGLPDPAALRLARSGPGQGHGPGQVDVLLRPRQPARHGRRHPDWPPRPVLWRRTRATRAPVSPATTSRSSSGRCRRPSSPSP
ncbi:hypothetical protein GCM10020221_23070 [Streptomyces thioluteus]|uniref:Murein biosynthesis integral membrane protein MurJ n=1 Tax=Streptomyces thioluteus TaxID=66431 RepID=A0ABN3WSF9_STRTU